jgi:hypothetical protein
MRVNGQPGSGSPTDQLKLASWAPLLSPLHSRCPKLSFSSSRGRLYQLTHGGDSFRGASRCQPLPALLGDKSHGDDDWHSDMTSPELDWSTGSVYY